MNQPILAELEYEAAGTRKLLARIPTELFGYKPHDKNFTMGQLASHVVELYSWLPVTLKQEGIDFSAYKPALMESKEQLLEQFDRHLAAGLQALKETSNEEMMQPWTMRNGEQVYFTLPKAAALRTWVMNHVVHHRAQLGVYLRLNNIAVPSLYGPTADE